MLTSDLLKEKTQNTRFIFNPALFDEQVGRYAQEFKREFLLITRYYALFHIGFFLLGMIELFALLLFFPFFAKSTLIAFTLATIFLTAFTYFVLRFYFQAKKPEQFLQVKENFMNACKTSLPLDPNSKDYFLAVGRATLRFVQYLEGQEHQYYPLPPTFATLAPLMEKFSLWCHWNDVHQMKELLFFHCIQEETKLVKAFPTDLEAHAALANAYVALYKLYIDPRKLGKNLYSFISREYAQPLMVQKFQKAATRALEEFKILDHYAPSELWVHAQLATVYHDLKLLDEEIAEYETLLRLAPKDKDLLFRLGILYFKQGKNALALRLYEQLKTAKDPKADELISYYPH
jgi:tetratricopeptide (TPR) repeat protein